MQVEKTANTSLKRTHTWTIDKSADKDEVTLPVGEISPVTYTVKVDETSKDSDWMVDGTIKVTAPIAATVTSVTDTVSPGIAATVKNCSEDLPAALNAGQSLTCTYSANLPDSTTRTNTATATSGTDGVGDGKGTAEVNFANATVNEIDEQINVSDSLKGDLGTANADKTFEPYTLDVGPYDTCGDKTVENTASFTGSDGATGSDKATVTAHVQCKLTVIKKLEPADDTGKFNLLIDGDIKAPDVGNNGTTTQQVAPGSHEVRETAGTNTSLDDYVSKINCGSGDDAHTFTTVSFGPNDGEKTCTITNTRKGKAGVIKTVNKLAPAAGQTFTFELRQGASITSDGTPLEKKDTDSSGNISFTKPLVPGETYQICEWVMPGWNTNLQGDGLFVPGSMTTPQLPNPNVNNMTVCTNFTVKAGETRTFNVDNTPPPGGRALTIGFWKNWASCASSAGKGQKNMLDLALGIASKNTTNPPGGLVVSAQNLGSGWPNYLATYYLVLKGDPTSTINNIKPAPLLECSKAVNLLNKSTIDGKKKMANDPLFNMTAQLVAAQLNRFMGAGISGVTTTNIQRAVLLNGKYQFNGLTYSLKLITADTNLANCLATQLDNYNNDRPVSSCP